MRSMKVASEKFSGCESLPWVAEEKEIQESVSENKNKWFQPYIASSSWYEEDIRCSPEAEEDDKNPGRTSVFSRLGQNAIGIHRPSTMQDRASDSLTEKNGEMRKPISYAKCSATNLDNQNSHVKSGRPQTERERTLSCGACQKGGRARACRHHIKEQQGSRSQEIVGKFEDQRLESKSFKEMTNYVNMVRSKSRIYGGLGRQMNWTSREETYRKPAKSFPETDDADLPEPQFTYEQNAVGSTDKKKLELRKSTNAEIAETANTNADQNFQEDNLLTDIFTSFSDGISDDFDDTSSGQNSQDLHNHAPYSLQSNLEGEGGYQNLSLAIASCPNHEKDSAHLEMVRNNSESKFCVNGIESTMKLELDFPDEQIPVEVDDLEEGEILGASDIEGIRTGEENEAPTSKAPSMNFNHSKFHIENSRGSFEAESLKPTSQEANLHHRYCTQGEKRHTTISLKRARKNDFFRDSAGYRYNTKTFIRSPKSFGRISQDVRVSGMYLNNDLDKLQGSDFRTIFGASKPILSDNASRNGFRTLDVKVTKLEHRQDLHKPNKYMTYESEKENVGSDDYGFTTDAHNSKFKLRGHQSKSFSTEFKEKCSIKPSAKRELMLDPVQNIKARREVPHLLNRKFEIMDDDGSGCKIAGNVHKAMGKWNTTNGENEQGMRNKEKPSSHLHTWRRASKVAKIADGCPEHKISKEMKDSTQDPHDAAMSTKPFVEDFSEKFRVNRQPCIQKKPKEQDAHRLNQRLRQINFGKNTLGYERYLDLVPRYKRAKPDPQTPDIHQLCSKRSWDGQVSKWRRSLHFYDPPVQEDEEFPEAIGVIKAAGNNVEDHEGKIDDSLPAEHQEVKDSDLSIYGDWMEFGPADEELFQETDMADTSYLDEKQKASPDVEKIPSTV